MGSKKKVAVRPKKGQHLFEAQSGFNRGDMVAYWNARDEYIEYGIVENISQDMEGEFTVWTDVCGFKPELLRIVGKFTQDQQDKFEEESREHFSYMYDDDCPHCPDHPNEEVIEANIQ